MAWIADNFKEILYIVCVERGFTGKIKQSIID